MKKKLLNEEGHTSMSNLVIGEVYVRKRKIIATKEEVPKQPVDYPISPKSYVHQIPRSKFSSKKYIRNNKDKELVSKVEFQTRKTQTRDTNKLRLNSKTILIHSLKSAVIILDDTLQEIAQKTTIKIKRMEHETNDKRKLGGKKAK